MAPERRLPPFDLRSAMDTLAAKDARLAPLIKEAQEFRVETDGTESPYEVPCGQRLVVCELERVPQRELNQPWRANGARYLPEGRILQDSIHTARRPRCALKAFDIGHCRIAKVGVVPNVEEVRGEAQTLVLADLEILDQRKVPVLL